jgi:outer membrane protein OmpA-like peptidoglycan-associated protein
VVALPPATASADIAPVVALVAPTTPLVAPVAELISRTASVDGAVGHDEAPAQEQYTLSGDVFFETNSAALTARAQTELAAVAASLAAADPGAVQVVGHTDSVDDDAYNLGLSQARATAVRDHLVALVPGLPVTVEGRGETQPVAVEEGSAAEVERARALNRRVEIRATR